MSTLVTAYDVEAVRARFPALRRRIDDQPVAWLDGPAGTQVPEACLDAIRDYLRTGSANTHGAFAASAETDGLVAATRAGVADLLGASDPDEIAFGPNMTTITFALSRAIAASLAPGDEIVLTRMDHDANVAPWLAAARERDLVVRWIEVDAEDCTLRLDGLDAIIGPRTRLVAIGLASNAIGTINPVGDIAAAARAVGARVWVDAVHGAPHLPIDVSTLGADFLVCSAYKLYGPHVGILWGRRDALEALPPYHVRPAGDTIPGRFETGTLAFELLAGLSGTLRHLEWLGVTQGGATGEPGADDGMRPARLRAAMDAAQAHERGLVSRLIERVGGIDGVRIRGITDPVRSAERCPTIAFTVDGRHPRDVARSLGERGIFVWDGDYYAWELIRALGLEASGGMVRVGLVNYNTAAEVERLGSVLEAIVAS